MRVFLSIMVALLTLTSWADPAKNPKYSANDETEKTELTAYLGVVANKLQNEALRKQLKLPKKTGLIIEQVAPDSPAAKAGLRIHDVLLEMDKQVLLNQDQLRTLIQIKKPGDTVSLKLISEGKEKIVDATLAGRPSNDRMLEFFQLPDTGTLPKNDTKFPMELRKRMHAQKGNALSFEVDLGSLMEIYGDESLTQEQKSKKAHELLKNKFMPNFRIEINRTKKTLKDLDADVEKTLKALPETMRIQLEKQIRDKDGKIKHSVRVLQTPQGPMIIMEESLRIESSSPPKKKAPTGQKTK